jgi:hypothetical protein
MNPDPDDSTPAAATDSDDPEATARVGRAVPDRRRFLQALSASAVSTSLAGCGQLDLGAGSRAPLRDLDPGDRTDYPGAFRFGDAYRMQVTRPDAGTPLTTARFDGEDRYLRLPRGDAEPAVESYIVDGDGYVVVDGECTSYPDVDAGTAALASVAEQPGDAADTPELEVTDTTTLDGREMLVLTVPAAEFATPTPTQTPAGARDGSQPRTNAAAHGDLTYYVDAETRYPRWLETAATVVDYRSWGDVEPITVPDLDCVPVE